MLLPMGAGSFKKTSLVAKTLYSSSCSSSISSIFLLWASKGRQSFKRCCHAIYEFERGSSFQLDKMQKAHGYLVYRFPIHFDKDFKHPEEDLKTGKHNLSEMGEGTFTKLFQYFYEVESSGLLKPQEPLPKKSFPLESKLAYLKMPKTHFHILVSGQNSKDPFLWDLISRNLKIEAKTSDEVKGSCVICQNDFNLHFSRVDKIPKGSDFEVDGIIFTDFQENPEDKVDEMKSRFKAKTFIFYETPAPNPRRASYIYYLSKEDIEENKTANEVFLIFVRHLMSDY